MHVDLMLSMVIKRQNPQHAFLSMSVDNFQGLGSHDDYLGQGSVVFLVYCTLLCSLLNGLINFGIHCSLVGMPIQLKCFVSEECL